MRFTGLNIHGTGEPSHILLDEVCSQFESRALRYVEPHRCTSRELEITSGRSDKKLKLDAGTLSVKESRSMPDEAISTTFHLAQCLRRRALAYEFANLLSFRVHELYTEKLLKHLSTEPPNGYQATTMAQVLRADKEVFNVLAQEVCSTNGQRCEAIGCGLGTSPSKLQCYFSLDASAQVCSPRGISFNNQKTRGRALSLPGQLQGQT